ncbi:bromodomain and PHD finger-containing protein 3, partial [Mycena rebaudengoi]
MARGGQVSPVATIPALPKVSFQKIDDDGSTQPSGVHDGQARTFGYNDFSEFHRPDQYIRHIEPLEIDLERQVEYDMDEQDQEWLEAVNTERKKEQLDRISHEIFEVVMDRLEKEWFNLTKHIPKPDLALPSEDSTCAICDDSEGENSNAIVFCDGCNLAVHQDCYGVPYIPEGQWLCRKCTVSPENPVGCILCPNEGGAFKQTTQGDWIHLLCAIWVPETRVANDVFMEPITGVERISKQRWKLRCHICETREGACIQCAKQSCFLAFHVTCARKDKLLLPMKSAQGSEPGALTCFCDRHLPAEQAKIRKDAKEEEEKQEEEDEYNGSKYSKSARAYAKTYKPGPPLVPAVIIDRILQYINRASIRKKPDFVTMMCKYWSLKREARRGAPLLKRLHLEPWTASNGGRMQGEEEKVMKLELLQHLRKDLEDLKGLAELSRKREGRKLRQAELIHDVLSQTLLLHDVKLRAAFERITGMDRNDYFKNPVSKKDVPDYFDIVQNPMSWSNIESKLDNHEYWDIQAFKDDIQLVIDNAILYNKAGTAFQKTALRIQTATKPILAELDKLASSPSLRSTDATNEAEQSDPAWTPPEIGDLEPPLPILELLLSADAIQDESELILSADPLTSLFNYEFEKKKPPPPPSTPPPDLEALKAEKQRKQKEVEKQRRLIKRAAEKEKQAAHANVEASSSVSAPPRRRGRPKGSKADDPMPSPPRERRPSTTLSAKGDIPLVDHVDEKKSFTMFEVGWILPAGAKRSNRQQMERSETPILPPPRKRARLDRRVSRMSVTPASENQTLHLGSPNSVDEPPYSPDGDDVDDSMDVDVEEHPDATTGTPDRPAIPPPNVIRTPDGQVIIEELDTPAIRREKNMRRKEERKAETAAAAAAATAGAGPSPEIEMDDAPLSPVTPEPEESMLPEESDADADAEADNVSELSALSDVDSDGGQSEVDADADADAEDDVELDVKSYEPAAGDAGPDAEPHEPHTELNRLERGTLVWAKAVSYPWWPAAIYHEEDPEVPAKVLKATQAQRKKRRTTPLHLVRFYDKTKSWQYLTTDKIRSLGEDKALDEDMLAKDSKLQKGAWKKTLHAECLQAY